MILKQFSFRGRSENMRALLRGLLCVPMAVCIPAWASGFCDGGSGSIPMGSECRQLDSTYTWGQFGPVVANYSDLDPAVVLQGNDALDFAIDLQGLSGVSSRSPIEVAVFELALVNGTTARTLVLGIKSGYRQRMLKVGWWQADPYWSTANIPLETPTLAGSAEYALGTTYANIRIEPLAGWEHIAVKVDGNAIGMFDMPGEGASTSRTVAARMRSGVISANPLQPNMVVSFDFHFPQR
jgi:hypothetical protein